MANEMIMPAYGAIGLKPDGDLQFNNLCEVMAFAGLCEKAQFLPKGVNKEGAVLSIVAGIQLGLPAFSAIQNIAVINGRPCVWGDALGGLVKASGLLEDEYIVESMEQNNYKVEFHVKRKGVSHETVKSFSFTDAQRAGLLGIPGKTQSKAGPWSQYPKVMVERRARAFAYREAFPDVLKGIRIREEEEDAPIEVIYSDSPLTPRKLTAGAVVAKQQPAADNPAALFGKQKPAQGDGQEPPKADAPAEPAAQPQPEPAPAKPATTPDQGGGQDKLL